MLSQHQLRVIFFYEWRRGSNASTAVSNINDALGEGTVSHSMVSRWFTRFKSGDTSLEDGEREGRPPVIDNDELELAIKSNPEATSRELARTFRCSQVTIELHHQDLGYRRVLTRWIPHRLTEAQGERE